MPFFSFCNDDIEHRSSSAQQPPDDKKKTYVQENYILSFGAVGRDTKHINFPNSFAWHIVPKNIYLFQIVWIIQDSLDLELFYSVQNMFEQTQNIAT